ncbi:guanylate-binding protein 1-like isoform X2 [Meleagris gallopavo]|uniref:guanylate-binding protein 1-like isoform X2 n=1 Tax=Meleagris gallopavo TaxID=9103 RepID=UPI0012ABB39D|nr:guanylate-binding protein 1-like isoform X2 [Meleagris gallopavo]
MVAGTLLSPHVTWSPGVSPEGQSTDEVEQNATEQSCKGWEPAGSCRTVLYPLSFAFTFALTHCHFLESHFQTEASGYKQPHRPALQSPAVAVMAALTSAAPVVEMEEPICLVENHAGQGLAVRRDALQVLANITQPVVVVAVSGLYRSGKSYLMNRLAGRRTGFSLGSSVQAHTKGIWMWCVPHPLQPGHTLVLLDTEGLGDVEKGDTKNDTWIFVLAVLLSSTLIYNSKGTVDQQALENLHYVLTLAECVKLTKSPGESGAQPPAATGLAAFFPTFVWAVRDFTLQLEADGQELSEDEYLENALKLRGGSSPEAERYDRLRECIRQFFPERRCFIFDQPASKRDLPRLEELPDDRMDPEFLRQLEKFRSYIWERSPPKTIPSGCKVTGEMLGTLVETYVDAIRSGAVPCLESAVTALVELRNSAAVREAAVLYRELLEQRAELPMETEELLELHEQCQRETLQLFAERTITDDVERFRAELLRQVEAAKLELCSRNEEASREKCTAALQELYSEMEQRISDGVYFMPGGHQLFLGDQRALVERYRALPGKGVKADAVLQQFLQNVEPLARSICSTDRALTEKDEQIKDLQDRNEKAEQEREAERGREAERLRQMEDWIRGYEKAEKEWEAERERAAEQLRKMENRARRSEEEALQLRKRLWQDEEKEKSHSQTILHFQPGTFPIVASSTASAFVIGKKWCLLG